MGRDRSETTLRRWSLRRIFLRRRALRRIFGTGNAQSGNASISCLGAHETMTPGLGVHDYRSPGVHESMVTEVLESRVQEYTSPGVLETMLSTLGLGTP